MHVCARTRPRARVAASIYTHTNMQYLLLFLCNNGFVNAPQCYVIRTLPVLFLTPVVIISIKDDQNCRSETPQHLRCAPSSTTTIAGSPSTRDKVSSFTEVLFISRQTRQNTSGHRVGKCNSKRPALVPYYTLVRISLLRLLVKPIFSPASTAAKFFLNYSLRPTEAEVM
jgi:hypothetical protein